MSILLLFCIGCSGDPRRAWTEREWQLVLDAEADIHRVFGDVSVPIDKVWAASGDPGGTLGQAFPGTGAALIWVDVGSPLMLRSTVTHELLHLMGCWEHGGSGIMSAWATWPGLLTDSDYELCAGLIK